MEFMRAVVLDRFGDADALAMSQRPVPEPLPTEVRVRVEAAGVNPVDWKTRAGDGMAHVMGDPPMVLGWDVSGVVDKIGPGVTRFAVGDPVFGMPWFPRRAGAYAEYVTAPSRHFAARPARLGAMEAAALPLAGLTAWQSLVDIADVQRGQRVLVHAAAGGVGHLAVQIAKSRGAYVVGTASSAKHRFLGELGLDEVVNYQGTRFEQVVEPVDVVLDTVGGDVALRSLDVLRPGGLLVCVQARTATAAIEAAPSRGVRAVPMLVEPDGHALEQLAALVEAGELRPVVERGYPLAEASAAHRQAEAGRTTGKIVLTI
ncbi:NADP-dependent oxidoreductase [Pseudonocardia eucalypti]|uniref:NADP-dependent oxidoreductase n=1 Tax=Pseudonocardia eucalypti TaxID=648755 RepID=A0ABP9R641_9PSEU|nr:NADPH:quinone reductase-like Zn-dependent oxidoreductase [Pseudonocardia eucalypti]